MITGINKIIISKIVKEYLLTLESISIKCSRPNEPANESIVPMNDPIIFKIKNLCFFSFFALYLNIPNQPGRNNKIPSKIKGIHSNNIIARLITPSGYKILTTPYCIIMTTAARKNRMPAKNWKASFIIKRISLVDFLFKFLLLLYSLRFAKQIILNFILYDFF